MNSKSKVNEPETALMGHKNFNSREIFQSDGEQTSHKPVDSEENLTRHRRMPLMTIPVGKVETVGSKDQNVNEQSPTPSLKLKVDLLEQVTSSNKRETEMFEKGAITDKIYNKSDPKISSNQNKSQKTRSHAKDLSNPDLNSVESAFKSINQPNVSGDIVDKLMSR